MKHLKKFKKINKKAMIISGFPGIGKSYFYKLMIDSGKKVLDSDSSLLFHG